MVFPRGDKRSDSGVAPVGNTYTHPTHIEEDVRLEKKNRRLLLSVASAAALFTFLIKQISGGENEFARTDRTLDDKPDEHAETAPPFPLTSSRLIFLRKSALSRVSL